MVSERGMLNDHCWESDQWTVMNENRSKLITSSTAEMNPGKGHWQKRCQNLHLSHYLWMDYLIMKLWWNYVPVICYMIPNREHRLSTEWKQKCKSSMREAASIPCICKMCVKCHPVVNPRIKCVTFGQFCFQRWQHTMRVEHAVWREPCNPAQNLLLLWRGNAAWNLHWNLIKSKYEL